MNAGEGLVQSAADSNGAPRTERRHREARAASAIGPLLADNQTFLRYGAAFALVALICALRLALNPLMGRDAPFLPFVLAVFAAAYLGGLGPALFAAFLAPVAITPFFTAWPHGTHVLAWSSHAAFFIVVSALVAWMMHQLQKAAVAQRLAVQQAREAQHAAQQSAAQLRLIADALPVLISYVDADQRYRFNNKQYQEWFGQSPDELVGKPVQQVLDAGAYEAIRPAMEKALSGQPVHLDTTLSSGEGTRHIAAHLVPDFGPGNLVRGYFALMEDVTERKQAEQALMQANRRKDEFLVMLAHELRNPLAPIRTVAHVLKNDQLDLATIRRNSELLQRQASHLARLVDDLLDVARITRGMIELRKTPVSLQRILDTAVETVHPILVLKHQTVHFPDSTPDVRIDGDAVRLSQVFTNLLSNAAKFSPEHALIEVRAETHGSQVVVSIRDQGVGLSPEELPQIFDLFMQADHSLDRSQGGLGVGLTIVRRLVEMHDGEVEARSDGLGRGSQFIVRLPRYEGSEEPGRESSSSAQNPSASRRVLVVDDNADAADSLTLYLRMAGHEARTAYDGPSALAALEDFAAEIVLLDIGLPHADGYVVARSMRERFSRTALRIYALTGYGRGEDRARALESGFDGHLVKPVDPEALLQLIESAPAS